MTGSLDEDCKTSAMPGEASPDARPSTRIVVCSSCRLPGVIESEGPRAGALLAQEVNRAARDRGIVVAQVPCLANCKRSLSAAILRAGGWSYVFGDLTPESAVDLLAGAELLEAAPDGLLPWRGRPDSLKRGLVARIPPLSNLEDVSLS